MPTLPILGRNPPEVLFVSETGGANWSAVGVVLQSVQLDELFWFWLELLLAVAGRCD